MVTGVHCMFFTPKAEELREFFRDVLEMKFFDWGGEGWLIFHPGQAEIGCHPAEKPFHDIGFQVDDIDAFYEQMSERGVHFEKGITDQAWGREAILLAPGDIKIQVYQPKY